MAGETVFTLIGNLCGDPELRFTSSGKGVANFTIATTPRSFDRQTGEWKDCSPLFMRCSLWNQPAENAVESLAKGMRVIAQGRLVQRSYETNNGEKRTVMEIQVDEIGPSLTFAKAEVTKAKGSSARSSRSSSGSDDSWPTGGSAQSNAGGGFDDEPPF